MNMDILFETVFGSHLYGTSNPQSDFDVRGVYSSSEEELVQGNAMGVKKSLCNDSDDCVHYSLSKFINMALKNDMVSFDMLHVDLESDNIRKYSAVWELIQDRRELFYSKRMANSLGMIDGAIKNNTPKALSHAYRLLEQWESIILNGGYSFPLRGDVLKTSLGIKMLDKDDESGKRDCATRLYERRDEVEAKILSSNLPYNPDSLYIWDNIQKYYFENY